MSKTGLSKRREADIERLRRLADASGGQLQITRLPDDNNSIIEFKLNLPTAGDQNYPNKQQAYSQFQVELPVRYPFDAPTARMAGTPIFHPNVFESGVICVGSKWVPSEGLDVYVTRLARLLCFDGMLVNMNSIAHARAGTWYSQTKRKHPDAFPSAQFDWDKPDDRVVRACPACKAKLRLPVGREGVVGCPRCKYEFDTKT